MDEGSITRAINNFFTLMEGELSVKKGDIVQVLKKIDRHWCYCCCEGKFGNVPSDYLIPVDGPQLEENEELFIAMLDFTGQQSNDLSFRKGDFIIGTCKLNEDWWNGKIGQKSGVFPVIYAWKLQSKYFKRGSKSKSVNMTARVLMNLKAQLEEEIDLHEGEIISIIEILDENWYRGISQNGSGIFPSSYVRIIDEDCKTSLAHDSPQLNTNTSRSSDTSSDHNFYSSLSDQDIETFLSGSQMLPRNNDLQHVNFTSDNNMSPFQLEISKQPANDDYGFSDDDYFKVNMPALCNAPSSALKSVSSVPSITQPYSKLDIQPYGITLYPFSAQYDNELSFYENEVVSLLRHIGKDWIEGTIDDRKGIFPSNYIKIVVDCETYVNDDSCDQITYDSHRSNELFADSHVFVLYSFDAQIDGDLSVKKGEEVRIIEFIGDEWCRVQNEKGHTGFCPRTYLFSGSTNINSFDSKATMQSDSFNFTDSYLHDEYSDKSTFSQKQNVKLAREDHEHEFSIALASHENSIDSLIQKNIESLKCTEPVDTGGVSFNNKHGHKRSIFVTRKEETLLDNNPQFVNDDLQDIVSFYNEDKNESFYSNIGDSVLRDAEGKIGHVNPDDEIITLPTNESLTSRSSNESKCKVSRTESLDRKPHRPAPPTPIPRPLQPESSKVQQDLSKMPLGVEDNSVILRNKAQHEEFVPDDDKRLRDFEKRQNVISELVITEKEYVSGLKITYETFNLYNPVPLESRGVDVKAVFGNLMEVIHVSEDFLDMLQLAMKGVDEESQCIGCCFLKIADRMKIVYEEYCMNHDRALSLLEKYESDPNVCSVFNKGIETLRYQIACFDMSSILIKPVQRILKYPLILNELIKCTRDDHVDKQDLLLAAKIMTGVASDINEHKRRSEIVTKYLEPTSSRISRLSLHSVAKKSSRLGVMLSSTLGITTVTKDPKFDEMESMFYALEKSIRIFHKNVESFLNSIQIALSVQFSIAEALLFLYQEKNESIEKFFQVQKKIYTHFWNEFKTSVNENVLTPLNCLLDLFEGPEKLIQKRNDKLLDYDGCCARAEKNKDNRQIQDELVITRSNFEALNNHLLEELPLLKKLAHELFTECISAFISARKYFCGKITKQYFIMLDLPLFKNSENENLDAFAVKHHLVLNQLGRFNIISSFKTQRIEPTTKRLSLSPAMNTKKNETQTIVKPNQSSSQRAYLQSCYPVDSLYEVIHPNVAVDPLDLEVSVGHLVAVIKKKNPMNDSNIWFVDDGASKGFLPSSCLRLWNKTANSITTKNTLPSARRSHASYDSVFESPSSSSSRKSQPTLDVKTQIASQHPPSYREVLSASKNPYKNGIKQESYSETPLDPNYSEIFADHRYEEIPNEDFFYAIYDFSASGSDMLNIEKGQVVNVLMKTDFRGNSEWWYVEDKNGKRGYVPANFLCKHN